MGAGTGDNVSPLTPYQRLTPVLMFALMREEKTGQIRGPLAQDTPAATPLRLLCLGALGVVYGDIGTSPLYAVRECFFGDHPAPVSHENVLGILSLIFWSLVIVVAMKYHVYVLRMDNRGEGGILALMALVRPQQRSAAGPERPRRGLVFMTLGLFGAALLYGDGMITPAISVLSAIEGLEVATPAFTHLVVPITIVILIVLFAFQRRGTAGVGAVFGPIMLIWFFTLAVLGVRGIAHYPGVLAAINPVHAVRFFALNGVAGYLVLGAVFLVVTGGEALYADLGHFGEPPIQIDWFFLVGPSLLLNYFGQGALVLTRPETVHNPFYQLVPPWGLFPLVVLSTMATVIASQAIISGAFSLTRQSVQLGYLPRVEIVHTSPSEIGQIYIPVVNWTLMAATIGLVLAFGRSTNLAAAYGVAVTTTMVITTLLAFVATRRVYHWRLLAAVAVTAVFLLADLAFFGANMAKVPHGGWFPLVVAAVIFTVMTTWMRGRQILRARLEEGLARVDVLLGDVAANPPARVRGTAVFLSGTPHHVPPTLMHNLKHNKVLHECIVFLTVVTEEIPRVAEGDRCRVQELGQGFYRVLLRYGFMDEVNVPAALANVKAPGLAFPPPETTYFLGKETVLATGRPGMARWRERLFAAMTRNARDATSFFALPPNRVVELGSRVEM
jgi:KUP system potassium uptake protein